MKDPLKSAFLLANQRHLRSKFIRGWNRFAKAKTRIKTDFIITLSISAEANFLNQILCNI